MEPEEQSIRDGFAARMNEVCDDMGLPTGRGRQTALAATFQVTNKAARKWLLGLGYPEMALANRIANWAQVNLNWLLQGVGLKKGDKIDVKAAMINEAIKALPRELGLDLIDNLRAKLERAGKIRAEEPASRYQVMLDAYEQEIGKQQQ